MVQVHEPNSLCKIVTFVRRGRRFAPGKFPSWLFECAGGWPYSMRSSTLQNHTDQRPSGRTPSILYILPSTTIPLALLLPSPLALYAPEPPVAVGAAVRENKPTASYRSRAAGSSASSCDERAMCSLAPFARVLHLFSMVGVSIGSASE